MHEESPGLLIQLGHAVAKLCPHASLHSSSDASMGTLRNRCGNGREAIGKFIKHCPGLRAVGGTISCPLEVRVSIETVLCRDPAGVVISFDKHQFPGHHLFCTEWRVGWGVPCTSVPDQFLLSNLFVVFPANVDGYQFCPDCNVREIAAGRRADYREILGEMLLWVLYEEIATFSP